MPNMNVSWIQAVPLLNTGYHLELAAQVQALRKNQTVYPPQDHLFYALEQMSFHQVKVVIVGQDPFHGEGQAHGLAFSVPEGIKTPPSLRNIFKEIAEDVYAGTAPDFSTDLTRWARQGVLLLNASLSVLAGQAGSHRKLGWHALTDEIIASLSDQREHIVFMLWGKHAQSKAPMIDASRHLVLQAPHPSPLSAYRGFFGCRHFSKANTYLRKHGLSPVKW